MKFFNIKKLDKLNNITVYGYNRRSGKAFKSEMERYIMEVLEDIGVDVLDSKNTFIDDIVNGYNGTFYVDRKAYHYNEIRNTAYLNKCEREEI